MIGAHWLTNTVERDQSTWRDEIEEFAGKIGSRIVETGLVWRDIRKVFVVQCPMAKMID